MKLTSDEKPVLVWFRNDLRIRDNPALNAAVQTGQPVLTIYIMDEGNNSARKLGAAQNWFLHHSLKGLSQALEKLGGRLDIFSGDEEETVLGLARKYNFSSLFWNRRVGATETGIDTNLEATLANHGVKVESFQGNLLHEPSKLKTGSGGPYRFYSAFWKALSAQKRPRAPFPPPSKFASPPRPQGTIGLKTLDLLPTTPNWAENWGRIWCANEEGASQALTLFLNEGIRDYATGRDFPGKPGVSKLSPFLRFGLISPYQVWHETHRAEASGKAAKLDVEKFLKELVWREFSYHLLFHYPDLAWKNYQEKFDRFPWKRAGDEPSSQRHFLLWTRGLTGYPIIDAGMRELWQTGYMHNRVRMIAASLLVKHLLIHWRDGEAWFWDTLVDGDPANNAANWQWVAGSGADAAPYFRIFNPITQGKKFDPDGHYVRRYVPELSNLPDKYLHDPWNAPQETLINAGITLGKTYPLPIVNHVPGRERALEAFAVLKEPV